jgi:integrase
MRAKVILTRSGVEYKPSAIRSYETSLSKHVYPVLGSIRVGKLRRNDVQGLVDKLRAKGQAASTVHNTLDQLRVIARRAIDAGELSVDPFLRLSLPAVRNQRMRIEAPDRAMTLIDALPDEQRAFWALAFFAGLRRGELRALRCDEVDFDREIILVRRGWDQEEGPIDVKTDAGYRLVPMSRDPLRGILRAHRLQGGRHGDDLFLGRTANLPFTPSTVRLQALKAWGWTQIPNPSGGSPRMVWVEAREDALRPITAHEARHCAASYFVACGWDWKRVTEVVGHSDVRTTMNRYAKLVPGDEDHAIGQLDGYITRHRSAGA